MLDSTRLDTNESISLFCCFFFAIQADESFEDSAPMTPLSLLFPQLLLLLLPLNKYQHPLNAIQCATVPCRVVSCRRLDKTKKEPTTKRQRNTKIYTEAKYITSSKGFLEVAVGRRTNAFFFFKSKESMDAGTD